jgi:alcohol dehydrogenase (cytochrome c)
MRNLRKQFVLVSVAVASSGLMLLGQQQAAAGRYTAAQAASGRATYQAQCAGCHLQDLKGQGDAAPLAGSEFMDGWGRRSARELVSFMQLTMPPTRPGGLSQEEYVNIAAFILQSNGAPAGNQVLTAATDVAINSVATGQAPAATAQQAQPGQQGQQGGGRAGQAGRGQDGDAPAPAGGGRGRGAAPPVGITVAGEVKNYVPVTDAMLRTPEAGDWLMIRRDYHASNYSPLNQITTDNVRDLRLQWVWAMNEGGANQPAPIVHNGIIYLNNPGNVMQAINGRTGDVIWENRYGQNANGAAMRGIAIYDDKVFAATSDARLVALDAKTGKTVWQTTIGDRSKGNYGTSSGPIVAKGKLIQGLGGCQTYREEKCFISAYDAATGKELWRFNTVARRGEPGGDSWGSLPDLFRAGGESWITGSYDPNLNLTYWGTAQAKPWMPISRGMSIKDDALYTSSTVALDVEPESSRGTSSTRRRSHWTSTSCSSACSSTTTIRISYSPSARTASSGSSIGRPGSTSATRKRCSRTSGSDSILRAAGPPIGATFSNSGSGNGFRVARAPKAVITGPRPAITPAPTRSSFRSARAVSKSTPNASSKKKGAEAAVERAGVSTRCQGPTAISASWLPSTSGP